MGKKRMRIFFAEKHLDGRFFFFIFMSAHINNDGKKRPSNQLKRDEKL